MESISNENAEKIQKRIAANPFHIIIITIAIIILKGENREITKRNCWNLPLPGNMFLLMSIHPPWAHLLSRSTWAVIIIIIIIIDHHHHHHHLLSRSIWTVIIPNLHRCKECQEWIRYQPFLFLQSSKFKRTFCIAYHSCHNCQNCQNCHMPPYTY